MKLKISWNSLIIPKTMLSFFTVPLDYLMNLCGVSGEPKAIPWTHHTPLRCAADAWAHLDVRRGDVICWPTNLGWMVGPMIVYSAFLNGATLALYNGSPLGRGFGKFIQVNHNPTQSLQLA